MAGAALGPVLDSFEVDGIRAIYPTIIHIDGEYYAVAYKQSYYAHFIKTYRIIADGTISEIDTWQFSAEDASYSRINHISGTLYTINYKFFDGTRNRGRLKTFHISNTGIITKSWDDEYSFNNKRYWSFLLQITGSYYALIADEDSVRVHLYTFTIFAGAGGITLVDDFYDDGIAFHVQGAGKIGTNIVFIIAPAGSEHIVKTIHVSNTGVITAPYVDEETFTLAVDQTMVEMQKVSDTIYALVSHKLDTSEIFLNTIQISRAGAITSGFISSLVFGSSPGSIPDISRYLESDRFLIAYSGPDGDGCVDVKKITAAGVISDDPLYSAYEFDDADCLTPQPLKVNGAWFPIFYTGPDGDGWLKSITFDAPPAGGHHELIMKIGP